MKKIVYVMLFALSTVCLGEQSIEYQLKINKNRKNATLIVDNVSTDSIECLSAHAIIEVENMATFRSTQTNMISLKDIYLKGGHSTQIALSLELLEDEGITSVKVKGFNSCTTPRFESQCTHSNGNSIYAEDFQNLKKA